MASQIDIDAVKSEMPDQSNWTDAAIDAFLGALLDGGLSVAKVTLAFWASQVAKYSAVLDATESGTSNHLGQLFDQAKATHDIWLERVKAEAVESGEVSRN